MALAAQLISNMRADRLSVELDATMRDASTKPIAVEIDDISVSGFRMQTTSDLGVGDDITIGIAGLGMRSAVVVRHQDGVYGCLFAEQVPYATLAALQDGPRETVARFVPTQTYVPGAMPQDDRYPARTRVAIIVGLSSLSWLVIGAGIARLF